jgi:ubiquinone/menaquinone biosynthesis C-methylase UbiE
MEERAHPSSRDFKDRFFGLIKNRYRGNLYKRYEFANKYIRNKIILDIPCGMGWGTSLLMGYRKAYGVDNSQEAIGEARRRYHGIEFIVGDMTGMPLKNRFFDIVICLEGLEHITFQQGQKFVKETKRVFKRSGIFIVSTPILKDGKYHSWNKYHLYEYREDELFQIIDQNKFTIMERQYIYAPTNEIMLLALENYE